MYAAQRHASSVIDIGDDISYLSAQVMANHENFDQTIMEIGNTYLHRLSSHTHTPGHYHYVSRDYQKDEESWNDN